MAIGKIKIDRNLCIGAGTCAVLAPNTFELDDELKAVLKRSPEDIRLSSVEAPAEGKSSRKKDPDKDILASAKGCPVAAIILEDAGGKQIYP